MPALQRAAPLGTYQMAIVIGRREFISALGLGVTYPLAARALQPTMPVIGWLSGTAAEASKPTLGAFQNALGEAGYVEGRNIQFDIVGLTEGTINCRQWQPISSRAASH